MYCKKCGSFIPENTKFCTSCGLEQDLDLQTDQAATSSSLVGYSDKINDPRIAENLEKMNRSGMVFTMILAVLAVFGFSIAGALDLGGLELPTAFFLGLALGGLLIVIALFQRAKGKKDGTWDGVIVDKTLKKASYASQETGDYRDSYYAHIRLMNGRIKKLSLTEDLFNYYNVGDHVRHHAGTLGHVLEKYDKSGDSVIYCIVCTSKNGFENDICRRCKSPLLK